jgi:hypothetical protein
VKALESIVSVETKVLDFYAESLLKKDLTKRQRTLLSDDGDSKNVFKNVFHEKLYPQVWRCQKR